jgi:hypothetical protein
MVKNIIELKNWATYETFIIVGIIMALGSALKIFGKLNFSSDWFWLLAGLGLVVEGSISLVKQRRFERKYKIVDRYGNEV